MAPNPRIEELRKRLEKEPASRLFAQLAEELRKEGELEDAIRVSREGLQKHPNYPSARMTLGRALLDSGDSASAAVEFDAVLKAAPDNILASRFLAECYESVGDTARAEAQYRHTLALSPGDKQVTARLEALAQPGGRPTAVAAAAPPPVTVPAGRVAATSSPSLPRVPSAAIPPRPVAVAPPLPPGRPAFVAPAPPSPAPEPPPIPLVDADEDFELERPYEAPPPAAVATMRSTAEEALAREFARQAAAPPPPPPAPVAPPPPLAHQPEQVFEETDIAGTTLPPLGAAELMTAARKAAEEQRTARFAALDDDEAAAAEVEPEELAPAVPGTTGARRPGLETLFRFSAFDGEASESAVSTPDAPPAPVAAPAPPPAPVRVQAPAPAPEPEIVSSTMAELYFTQGHIDKAIDVYRKLLRGGPENDKARVRLIELETLERKMREEAAGPSAAERRAVLERQIARLEALLSVIRKE